MALEELRGAARLIRSHHERFDGQGFPDGLSGLSIPVGARILAVANDYDGLQIGTLAARRYTAEDACRLVAEGRGRRYDPVAIDAFLEVIGRVDTDVLREREVSPPNLEAGMVLSRDLVSREGVLLLSAEYILDAGLIRQIREYARDGGITTIYVRLDGAIHEKTAAR
jgi:hypothetical protein